MLNRTFLPVLIVLFLFYEESVAQWPSDSSSSISICNVSGDQRFADATHDCAGGAFIVWQDGRNSSKTIYAQRIDSSGTLQWENNGIIISSAYNSQIPKIASDGVGGAFITWFDFRGETWPNSTVCVQRINKNGDTLWQANGIILSSAGNSWPYPVIASYGVNGAIISWIGLDGEIFAQKIDTSGNILWDSSGVMIDSSGSVPKITLDDAGGAIITWFDYNGENPNTTNIFARRVSSSGVPLWVAGGDTICVAENYQQTPNIVSDGNGGAIITWIDSREDSASFPFAQHISADGDIYFAPDGLKISSMKASDQIKIASDGAGGAVIAWLGGYNTSEIYVQRFNGNGISQWPDYMRLSEHQEPTIPTIISDGSTGVFVLWQYPSLNVVKVQHISSNGTLSFGPDGKTVSLGYGLDGFQTAITDGTGKVIVAWEDMPQYNNNISAHHTVVPGFVTNVSKEGQQESTPQKFALHQNYPNPFNPSTTIEFSLSENSNVTLIIYDQLGREVATVVNGERKAGVLYKEVFNATSLASGMYFYRLQTPQNSLVKKLLFVK